MTKFLKGLLSSTALVGGALTATAASAITIPTVIDGANGTGIVVSGNSSITGNGNVVGANASYGGSSSQTVYTNFRTSGGNGSGGGGGLGGVFFIDQGATLTLNNVSFSGNTAKGGDGGGASTASITPVGMAVAARTAEANASQVYLPTISATYDSGTGNVVINSFTLSTENDFIAAGAGVSIGSGLVGAKVGSITTANDGGQQINLDGGYIAPSSNVFTGTQINGDGKFLVSGSVDSSALYKGMLVFGDGVPAGTTVASVEYNNDQTVKSYTLSNTVAGTPTTKVLAVSSFEVTRFESSLTTQLSTVITPTAALGGFEVGMTVTGTGVPAGTKVTAIDGTTGAITLSNSVDLSQVKSFKASFSPLISNSGSAVLQLSSTNDLAVGQKISGAGIAAGTTITAINGNNVTLSSTIANAGVTAINKGTFTVTIDPVTGTGANSVTLVSVAGLQVGQILVGDSRVPANAVITGVDSVTKTVTYRIDASVAALNKGGSMNGLVTSGSAGNNGGNGVAGSSFTATFVDGEGTGGTNGGRGGNSTTATGGNGGNGGSGSNGVPFNAGLVLAVANDSVALGGEIAEAAGALATFPPGAALAAAISIKIGLATATLVSDTAQLINWGIQLSRGAAGFGGGGGTGGAGGNGGTFFGGGAGGVGGAGGDGALSFTDGGAGGDGGSGGKGGFGAGGGNGGAGGTAGSTGNAIDGGDGSGGSSGFGGGAGSSNNVGGQGGSGFGGALFVRDGGTLNLIGNAVFEGNATVAGSSNNGGAAGEAGGTDMFMMKGSTVNLRPGTGHSITFNGSIADNSAASIGSASIASGSGASIHIGGGGLVQFLGANTYTGTTYVEGGTLRADDGVGLHADSHLLFAGSSTIGTGGGLSLDNSGIFLTSGTFTRRVGFNSNQVSWTDSVGGAGGSGGFAATADGLTLSLGQANGTRQSLTWGTGGFVNAGSTLVFGSDAAAATGAVTLLNNINLNNGARRIAVYDNAAGTTDYAVMSGVLSNGQLIVGDAAYSGQLYLTGQNTLTGIAVQNGTVATKLGSTTGRLMDATLGGTVNVTGGTLILNGNEKLTTTGVGANGKLYTYGVTTADSISNAGLTSLAGATNVSGAIINASTGTLVMTANVAAASVQNDGNWGLGADLTVGGATTNNGNLTVLGTLDGAGQETAIATRTINTASFTGASTGVVNLGGLDGTKVNTLVLNQSGAGSYAGSYIGAGKLTKSGAGTLTLTGASTFTGGLTISAGAINTTGGGTLADTLDVTVASGATFTAGTNDTIHAITNAGTVNTTAAITLTGDLGNTGGLTNSGALRVDGATTNSGTMTLSGGSALLASLSNSGTVTASAPLTVTGLVDNAAAGTINLQAGSTPAFGSLTNAGTITVGDALTVSGAYTQNAGTLTANANVNTGSFSGAGGSVHLNGSNVMTVNQSADGTYAGEVTGSGTFNKAGTATLTLTGVANSFTPAVVNVQAGGLTVQNAGIMGASLVANVVAAGTLTLSANQSIATLTNNGLTNLGADLTTSGTVTNNGTLTVTGDGVSHTINTAGFAGASTGEVKLGGADGTRINTLVLNQSGASSYAGIFSGAGKLTKTGAGVLTLTGASSFTGGLLVDAGGIDTTGGGTLADTLDVTVSAGASYTVGTADLVRSITNAGTVTANANLGVTTLSSSGTATINALFAASGDVTNTGTMTMASTSESQITGALSNSGTLTGSGILVVNGATSNSATMSLTAGAATHLVGAFGNSGGFTNAGTLQVDGLTTNSGTMTLSGGSALLASLSNSGTVTASAPLTVTGLVDNAAAGTIALQAGSTPAFGSLTNAGTITVDDALTVSGAYTQNAGTLTANANVTTGSFSGAGGSVHLNGIAMTVNQSANGAYAGEVTGSGTFNKAGTATLTLTGVANSFTPAVVNVQAGGLTVQNAGILGASLVANVSGPGTLTLSANQSIATLTNNGLVNLGADLTTSGVVTNNRTLTVTGEGVSRTINTVGFTGASTGEVKLGGADGAKVNTLILNQLGASSYAGILSGAGKLTKTGAGVLTLTGASSFTGGLAINAGGINTTGGGTLADTLDVTVASGASFTVGTADVIRSINNAGTVTANANLGLTTLTSSGSLANNAALTVSGTATNSGTLVNSGALKVDGVTTNSGTMTLSGGSATLASLSNSGTVTASAPLTVTGTVNNATSGTLRLNAGAKPVFGSLTNAGTITVSDVLTINGAYVQNAGTLTASSNVSTGSLSGAGGTIALANGSRMTVNQTVDGTYAGRITGRATIDKVGAATLTLSGATGAFAPATLNIIEGGVTAATANVLDTMLSVSVAKPATLTLLANQSIHDLSGAGVINLGTNNLVLVDGGNFIGQVNGTGAVQVQSGTFNLTNTGGTTSGSLTVQPTSTLNVAETSAITTTDLTVNASTLNLMGSATATTTNVTAGGTLHLGNGIDIGKAGAATGTLTSKTTVVNGGGQLTGNGTITGDTIIGGASTGTLAPGNSPGILTFDNLTLASNSVTIMQVDGPNGPGVAGGNDLIVVNGTLTISGNSTLQIGKSAPPSSYELALGGGVQLFKFAPGAIKGSFGSVTMANFTRSGIFNLSDGTLLGLGTYTPQTFTAAVATDANRSAILNTMFVSNSGGVSQYYGGKLLASLTAALASGTAAVDAAFKRWSPEGYSGILDSVKYGALQNLPQAGGYENLEAGRLTATGSINHDRTETRDTGNFTRSKLSGTGFNVGFAADAAFAQVSVGYTRLTNNVRSTYLDGKVNGDQFGGSVSLPLGTEAVRAFGQLAYGKYRSHGTRDTLGGQARFGSVKASAYTYGLGLEYYQQYDKLLVNGSVQYVGIDEKLKSFTETSTTAGLDLFTIRGTKRNSDAAKADLKLGYSVSEDGMLYAKVSYIHEFGNGYGSITADTIGLPGGVTVTNPGLARDRVLGGLGGQVKVGQGLMLNIDGSAGTQGSYRIGGGIRFEF